MTSLELGAILIVGAVTLFVVGWLPTIRSVMIFVGILLVGTSGHLTVWLGKVMGLLANLTSAATAWLIGAAVPGILAIVLLIFLIYDWHPKNKAGRRTTVIAAALAIMIAAGITSIGALNNLGPAVQSNISQTTGG